MARIDLEDPYTSFLESQVKSGLFNTISEAARDAVRKQMELYESRRLSSILLELKKGEDAIALGNVVKYDSRLMSAISEIGRKNALEQKPVRNEIRP